MSEKIILSPEHGGTGYNNINDFKKYLGIPSIGPIATVTSSVLPLTNGGTGANNAENARINLGIGPIATVTTSILPIENGGTGVSDKNDFISSLNFQDTYLQKQDFNSYFDNKNDKQILKISNGGTGCDNIEDFKKQLNIPTASKSDTFFDEKDILSPEHGGTGISNFDTKNFVGIDENSQMRITNKYLKIVDTNFNICPEENPSSQTYSKGIYFYNNGGTTVPTDGDKLTDMTSTTSPDGTIVKYNWTGCINQTVNTSNESLLRIGAYNRKPNTTANGNYLFLGFDKNGQRIVRLSSKTPWLEALGLNDTQAVLATNSFKYVTSGINLSVTDSTGISIANPSYITDYRRFLAVFGTSGGSILVRCFGWRNDNNEIIFSGSCYTGTNSITVAAKIAYTESTKTIKLTYCKSNVLSTGTSTDYYLKTLLAFA